MPLLEVKDLKTYFDTDAGLVKAVDGVSFTAQRGQTVGLVGESGCGKSITSLSIMRLLPRPAGRIAGGSVTFDGQDLLSLTEKEMQSIRGNRISMIFQEPMTSLNPVLTIGDQISEPLRLHRKMSRADARDRAAELLEMVSIPMPLQRLKEYPHQLSGGMRQRAMIAMALACNPSLLIADEPTTALDVTVQAQILDLMIKLQQEMNSAILFITHDLGVIAQMAQSVVVMYAGRVVEQAPVTDLFQNPLHPYTQGLMTSIPSLNSKAHRLSVIPGTVPTPLNAPPGCKFHTRCSRCFDECRTHEPPLYQLGKRQVRCWLMKDGSRPAKEEGQ